MSIHGKIKSKVMILLGCGTLASFMSNLLSLFQSIFQLDSHSPSFSASFPLDDHCGFLWNLRFLTAFIIFLVTSLMRNKTLTLAY